MTNLSLCSSEYQIYYKRYFGHFIKLLAARLAKDKECTHVSVRGGTNANVKKCSNGCDKECSKGCDREDPNACDRECSNAIVEEYSNANACACDRKA